MSRSLCSRKHLSAFYKYCFSWFLCLLATVVQAQTTAQQWAVRADQEADPALAETYYTKALALQPNADAVLLGRAIVRGRLRRFEEGIADATAAIALVDTSARYYAQRAYLRVQIKEYDPAALDYERAIQLKPNEANYYSGLSYCRVKQTRLPEALTIAEQGIRLNPASPYPYRNRGRAKLYSGQVDEAIADFQQSLDRKHGEAHRVLTDLGEAYERKKEYTRAADYYTKALDLKPGYADAEARLHGLIRDGLLPGSTGSSGIPKSISTFTGKRVALVIGNSEYTYIDPTLQDQPVNDAKAVDARLRELGFASTLEVNTEGKLLKEKIKSFCEAATNADLVFFYFAGHGLQYRGANYLLPTDIEVHPALPDRYVRELSDHALLITTLIEQLQQKNPRFCVIVLDACRDDPQKTAKTAQSAVASVRKPTTTARFTPPPFTPIVVENFIRNCCIAQATAAGSRAWNGPGKNGCYTEALLRYLKKGNTLEQTMKSIRNDVLETSQKAGTLQQPEYLNQTADDLIF